MQDDKDRRPASVSRESSGRVACAQERQAHYDQHEAIPQVRLLRFRLQVKKLLAASSHRLAELLQVHQQSTSIFPGEDLKKRLMLERCQVAFGKSTFERADEERSTGQELGRFLFLPDKFSSWCAASFYYNRCATP